MRLALALSILPALPAAAAIQGCYLDQMVAEAENVFQVSDHEVSGPDDSGGCVLTGVVARSFRGTAAVGNAVQVLFACANPDMLVGGTVYHGAETVAQAGAVELHTTADGGITGHGQGLLPIDKLTKAPVFQDEPVEDC